MLEATRVAPGSPLASSTLAVAAVLCAAATGWVLTWGPGGRRPVARSRLPAQPRRRWSFDGVALHRTWLVAAGVPGVVVVAVGPSTAALVTLAVFGALVAVVRRRRVMAASDARALTAAVAELVTALAADLSAGHPPVASIEALAAEQRADPHARAGEQVAQCLEAVLSTVRLGGDVPTTLRRRSTVPGAEGLRALAAGWEVAAAGGAALATVLDQVAAGLQDQLAADRAVAAALAGARSTAQLLAGLPLIGLAMGTGLGLSPVGFLLDTSVGRACLLVGLGLEVVGLAWTDALASAATRGQRS